MILHDEEARQAIRTALGETLVVEAAAGTGKTTELVARILGLLERGVASLSRIVAVTFTEKAAGEMKLRLRTEIEKARGRVVPGSEERARLDHALEELEASHIGTIHGFCAELLRQHPVEARVDPLFEVADEDVQERAYEQAFDAWFGAAVADPPEGVKRLLRRRGSAAEAYGGSGGPAVSPRRLLYDAGRELVEHRDFAARYRRPELARDREVDRLLVDLEGLGALGRRADSRSSGLVQGLLEIGRWVEEIRRREDADRATRDYDGLEQALRTLARADKCWEGKGGGRFLAKDLAREQAIARRDAVKGELDRFLALADADIAALLQSELEELVAAYHRGLERQRNLDYRDLLVITRDLLQNDAETRSRLQSRFSHLLVDEFQDTDLLQAEILLLLSADDPGESDYRHVRPLAGKLFVVGDPKQSIYRFRRADVTLYASIKAQLVSAGARVVHLTTSYRATPSLQHAINAAFEQAMTSSADGSQPEYVPLRPKRADPEGRPSVIALPVPRPYSAWGRLSNKQIDASLPDAVAAFIGWLVGESGWTVDARGAAAKTPIGARHVCLLFKRFTAFGADATRPYTRALEARRIPHVLIGGRSFHAREEVQALRSALSAVEWPDDDLAVYATLRGPFFALSDESLLLHRASHGSLHPLRPQGDGAPTEVTAALAILRELHRDRNRRPFADTVTRLLEATRAHAGIAIWPSGEQALANLLRIVEQAQRFEASGGISFRAFVRKLEQEAERGGAAEAPVVEEGTDGVRIMTVHKAKGLEFPVVVLADPTGPLARREPSHHVDASRKLWATRLAGCAPIELTESREVNLRHEREEGVRLAYVAATRARELLVVPVVGDEPRPGWVDVLHPALYPLPAARRQSRAAPGCPAFGEDTVLDRPFEAGRGTEASVRPGLHRAERGEHEVVWWDPAVLPLEREADGGLRQQWILAADEQGLAASRGERENAAFRAERAAVLERGSQPSLRVRTPTELGAQAEPNAADRPGIAHEPIEHAATSAVREGRPRGKRFGSLVHAVLAAVPWSASGPELRAIAEVQARLLGAPEREVEAAVVAVEAALAHPLLGAAREPGASCRRECPIAEVADDGTLVEGVVDLAFREQSGRWTVIDFKTDVELGERLLAYEVQVRAYVRAIARATGEPVRGVLLSV